MGREIQPDTSLISSLEDEILSNIISYLSVKKATDTSLLSKRWRNLYHQMKRLIIRDSEFVKLKWNSFVLEISTWLSRLSVADIEMIEIHILKPKDSEAFINCMVSFAVTRSVKSLVLDFSDPGLVLDYSHQFYLPDCIHNPTHIESLKLYACGIKLNKFQNSTVLKSFTIGWFHLYEVTTLLSKFPSLESLKFINCACIEGKEVIFGQNQNRLRELVFQNCDFANVVCRLDIPEIVRFKYPGTVPTFVFQRVNKQMQEAYLDFGIETESRIGTGKLLAKLVNDLSCAKTLTVCSYLLQVIQHSENENLQTTFKTRHLVMKASLHSNEFIWIRYMMNNSPDLESLTFELVPPSTIKMDLDRIQIEPVNFWYNKMNHKCLETLKIVKVKAFRGQWYEMAVVEYFIKYGLVLERLTLYVDQTQRHNASHEARLLSQTYSASRRLEITII